MSKFTPHLFKSKQLVFESHHRARCYVTTFCLKWQDDQLHPRLGNCAAVNHSPHCHSSGTNSPTNRCPGFFVYAGHIAVIIQPQVTFVLFQKIHQLVRAGGVVVGTVLPIGMPHRKHEVWKTRGLALLSRQSWQSDAIRFLTGAGVRRLII